MNDSARYQPDRDGAWLSAYVDGELEAADLARVEAWLAESDAARLEVERLQVFNALASTFRLAEAPPEAWEVFGRRLANRGERSVGWLLFVAGVAVVGAWGAWRTVAAIWSDPDLPLAIKLAVFATGAGLLVLLVNVLRERLYARKHTRYRNVIR